MSHAVSRLAWATVLTAAVMGIGVAAQQGGQADVALPDGAGKEVVQGTCSTCHGLNLITSSLGNTREGWRELFGSMVALLPAQADAVSAYLAQHFPPKPGPQPVLLPGPATATFKGVDPADAGIPAA